MRILILSNFYPPLELGGYGQLCQEVASALSDRGHQIRVLTSRHGVNSPQITQQNGITVKRALYLQSDIDRYRPLRFLWNYQREEQANQRELYAEIENFQPDLVFTWGMWNLSLSLPSYAEQLLPARVYYYVCSYWPVDEDIHLRYWNQPDRHRIYGTLKAPLRALAKVYLQGNKYPPVLQFQHTACVSHFVRDRLVGAGALPESARVIYNGGDFSAFRREPAPRDTSVEPLRLLFFGRLIADKGVHTALEALAYLKAQYQTPNVTLTILGDGREDYSQYLRTYAAEHGIDQMITFQPGVPRSRIPEWLQRHDVFLFTSIWAEPLARSVMEAMMAGLLVIGAEVGGQTEMLAHGVNALTFQPEDHVGLAAQISYAMSHPQLRCQMAKAGQEMVEERFSLDRMIDEMYDWLLNSTEITAKTVEGRCPVFER